MRDPLPRSPSTRRPLGLAACALLVGLMMPTVAHANPDPHVGVFVGDGVKLELAASGETGGVKEYVGRVDMKGGRQLLTAKGADKVSGLIGRGDGAIHFTLEVSGNEAELRLSGKTYTLRRGEVVGGGTPPPSSTAKTQPTQKPTHVASPSQRVPARVGAPRPTAPAAAPRRLERPRQTGSAIPQSLIGYWRVGSGMADWVSIRNGSFSAHGSMQSYTFRPDGTYEHVIYEKRNYQTIATWEEGVFAVRGHQIQLQPRRTDGFQEYNKRRKPLAQRRKAVSVKTWTVTLHKGHPFLTIDGVTRLARIR